MPGQLVSDSLALSLNDGGATTTSEAGSAGWVEADWPVGVAAMRVALGTCSGTSVVSFVTLEASDASDGSNSVVVGSAGPFSGTSDDTTYDVPVYIGPKGKYLRCYVYVTGSTPSITPTVTLVEAQYQRTATTTAGDAA